MPGRGHLTAARSARSGQVLLGVVLMLVLGLTISWRYPDSGASAAPPVVSAYADLVARPADCTAGTVRLTFDDGPSPDFTPVVLATLRAWETRASFFVLGAKVQQHPELVQEIVAQGHLVGNHTWSHPYLTTLPRDEVREELARTSDAIAAAIGEAPTEWRPPYEDWNDQVSREAQRQGMSMVLWDYATDSNDWKGISPEHIASIVVGNATDGSTILMHDIRQNAVDALPLVLQGLNEKGLCAR